MKKVLKSSLSLFLAVTIIFSSAVVGLGVLDFGGLFAVKASAASIVESGTCGENLTWTLDDEGTLIISGTGDMTDYHPLTSSMISSNFAPWFTYRESIKNIVLNSGITKIGSGAFQYCINPTYVSIPDSVVEIGEGAFNNCTNLVFVSLPNSVTNIGTDAFCNTAYYNDTYNWESNVLYIGNHLIEAKTLVSGYYSIKAGTKTIANYAFSDCTNLTSVTIPDSMVNIGVGAFSGCIKLSAINVDMNNAYYSSVDGVLLNADKTILLECPEGKNCIEYIIPNSVISISNAAFYDCTGIKSIIIPDSVTNIGDDAFYGCISLTSIEIGNNVTGIYGDDFNSCAKLTTINVGANNTNYSSVDGVLFNKDQTNLVRYPEGKASREYTIPDSVTSVNGFAFYSCKNLISLEISDDTVTIEAAAFQFCENLTTIIIPKSVTHIGMMAFWNCQSLARVLYKGTEEEWNNVVIEKIIGKNGLENATVYYNYTSDCDHLSSDWIIDTPATVSAPGSKHKECTVCGETLETAAIAQLKPATPKVATENALTGVLVKWNAVTGATKYQVYRRQGGSNTWTLVGTTTGTSLTDTKVSSGIYYVYSVRAYNNAGQYSDFVSANTQTRKYMAVPKLKGISNATNGLYITWNPVAGVTNGYRVYRRGAGSTYWTYLGTTKNTYFTDTQVKNNSGEYFRYTVIADGGYHSKFDTTGLYLRRLSNPTLKSATSASAGITVKWTPVKGCLGYYVYRKTANSGWVRVGVVNGVNASSYLDKTAKKGTTYTYTVRAVCGNVTSYFNSGISCKDKY